MQPYVAYMYISIYIYNVYMYICVYIYIYICTYVGCIQANKTPMGGLQGVEVDLSTVFSSKEAAGPPSLVLFDGFNAEERRAGCIWGFAPPEDGVSFFFFYYFPSEGQRNASPFLLK